MMLENDVELVDGLPIAYLKDIKALVLSDLHLGYEAAMAKRGMLAPRMNLGEILKMLSSAMTGRDVESIIVDGDIKNDFSDVDESEFNELLELAQFAKQRGKKLVLIKGNHDNFVDRYKKPFGFVVHAQEARIGRYLFFHGEELPGDGAKESEFLIMGHEHPAIGIYNEAGSQERLKCFLYGNYKGKRLLVLPAANYFSQGTAVNIEPKSSLLAPIFKKAEINRMHAVALGYGSTIDFGAVGKLREAASAG